jgi:hypothetical protein
MLYTILQYYNITILYYYTILQPPLERGAGGWDIPDRQRQLVENGATLVYSTIILGYYYTLLRSYLMLPSGSAGPGRPV